MHKKNRYRDNLGKKLFRGLGTAVRQESRRGRMASLEYVWEDKAELVQPLIIAY